MEKTTETLRHNSARFNPRPLYQAPAW